MGADRKRIYIETTIPSYATSRTSNDPVVAGRQALTIYFWEHERHKYDLYISQDVLDECGHGDMEAAKKRLDFISGIVRLPVLREKYELADLYQEILSIPDDSKTDCHHLAHCVLGNIDFLLSWNCRHLGISSYEKVRYYNEKHKLWTPLLVTPEHFTTI
jgi:hypothetical protein